MSLRDTELYKKITAYQACAIVEGFSGEEHTVEEQLTAWQHLHDTRVGYSLQGWYGRALRNLLETGQIEKE
jgi:hypothetical protein